MTAIPHRNTGHRVRRLGLPRPPRRARAGASTAIASASRCAGPISPATCSRSAGSARSMPCRPTCAIRLRSRRPRATPTSSINLVGILFERGRQRFDAVQAVRRRAVALAAAAPARAWCTSPRSAPTDTRRRPMPAPRPKARSRARGACRRPSILRPSIMFGPEDDFFNKFAAMARISPALPLIGGGDTRSSRCSPATSPKPSRGGRRRRARPARIYELGGPEVRSFKQLMRFVLDVTERRRLLVPLPFALARLQATFLQYLPKPLLTPDQVELLRDDNVVSRARRSAKAARLQRWASIRRRWKRSCRPISGASARPGSSTQPTGERCTSAS